MQFRKSTADDLDAVYRLVCILEGKALPLGAFSAIYRRQIADGRYCCLVCEDGGALLAVLNLRFEGQLHHAGRIAEVLEFVVDPACRSRGIGKAMFAHACRLAQENGCGQIELATNQLRTGAHRFYQREGMNNFHFKFSKQLDGENPPENKIGR